MESATRMSLMFERPGSDIKKAGYLKKLKTMKKKFFVMRSTSSSGPARLEYYDTEKKFRSGQPPKRVIHLHQCFNINKKSDTRTKNVIALYTREECFAIITENNMELDHWLDLLLEFQSEYQESGIPSTQPHFEYVWQVTIKQRGLGNTIRGPFRMCLSTTDICLVRNNAYIPEFTFQLSSIRRCGHSESYFFMDVGRSAPTGEGELWIQVDDSVIAQNMHEVILNAMKSSSSAGSDTTHFRQRSSTNTSLINRSRDTPHDFNGQSVLRPRTGSEGHRTQPQGSPRRRPKSSAIYPRSPNTSMDATPLVPHGHSPKSFHSPSSVDSGVIQPPVFHSYENQNSSNIHHVQPNLQGHLNYPGQGFQGQGHRFRSDSAESHGSQCSQKALSPEMYGSSPGDHLSHRSGTPDAIHPSQLEEYFDMSPGMGIRSTTPSPPHPFQTDRPVSDAITMPLTKHDGYIEMRPSSSVGSGSGNETGYMDMAIGTTHDKNVGDTSYMMMGPHGNRQSTSVPIPTRPTKETGYMDMTPTSSNQPLPTVKEGGSGESYLPMTPTGMSPRSTAELKPAKVISYLSDDSMSGEFPKRAYSLGSRPVSKTLHRHTHVPEPSVPLDVKVTDNGRSSSAPHLIVQKIKSQSAAYMPMDSSYCNTSVKSDDSDSFMELDFYRPRTASESFGYRPRASSFGKVYNNQGHRPRSSSYGQSSRGGKQLGSFESVRTTSKELLHKRSFESLGRFSTTSSKASSSESLRKLETASKSSQQSQQSDYVDMNMNRNNDTSGYIDMTIGQGSGSKCSGTSRSSSSQSLSSSPAVSGFISPIRPDKSSPDIKIIKASGHVIQKPVGFVPHHQSLSQQDNIPSQAALFSPVAFNSGSTGSRSPSVKGRSPASSGRESEEESYVPYQPASTEKQDIKENIKSSGKDSSGSDSGRFSLKKKKHKGDKSSKQDKHKKDSSDTKTFGRMSPKDGQTSPKVKQKYEKPTKEENNAYLEYEPGTVLTQSKSPVEDTSNIMMEKKSVKSDPANNVLPRQSDQDSDYMGFQPGEITINADNEHVDKSGKVTTDTSVNKVEQIHTQGGDVERVSVNTSGHDQGQDNTSLKSQIQEAQENHSGKSQESYTYMEFDPAHHNVEEGPVEVKTPKRVRSYIAEKSMEEEFKGGKSSPDSLSPSTKGKDQTIKNQVSEQQQSPEGLSGQEGGLHMGDINSSKSAQKSTKPDDSMNRAEKNIDQKRKEKSKSSFVNVAEKTKKEAQKGVTGKSPKSKDKRVVEVKSICVLPVNEEEDDGYVGLDFSSSEKPKSIEVNPTLSVDVNDLRPLPVRSEIIGSEGSLTKIVKKRLVSLGTEDNKSSDGTERYEKQVGSRKVSAPTIGQYSQKLNSNVRMSPVRKGSISSLGEESSSRKQEDFNSGDSEDVKSVDAVSVDNNLTGSELHKQNSMPCMTLPLADETSPPSVTVGSPGFFNNPRSRYSCSDLTGAYEQMSFPTGNNLETGHQQSSSQQQLVVPQGEPQLNYASLDLGSSETVDSNDPKSPRPKIRHPSSTDEAMGPPLSYAQIDFKKSENLKNSCNKDVVFSFD